MTRKSQKPLLPIMTDVETLSLRVNAALIDVAFGLMDDSGAGKRWLINPDSYNGVPGFIVDAETIAFHENNKSGLIDQARAVGISWRTAAVEIYDWLQNYENSYETHIWCQGKDFDISRLDNFFHQAGLKCPWKYSHTHCLRDLSGLFPEVKRNWFGNHTAMKDVIAQASHLKNICARNERAYNFVYGDDRNE